MTESLAGRTIGRYNILRAIREGGVGAVYQAEDSSLARPVALKFLRAKLAADHALVRRLHEEAKTMARLEHPNIVSIFDFVESPEHVYLVLQYVDGESLSERLAKLGRLPEREALRLVADCAAGLAAAHEQGILHRDVKPSNVMMTSTGEVKVADFGLAEEVDQDGGTGSTKVQGTPFYMSPEQCRGLALDPKSDIYSLGVMLYQLLTGDLPFSGRTIREVLKSHVLAEVPDPRTYTDLSISGGAAELVLRMMAKRPEERPDAKEVATAVRGILSSTGGRPDSTGRPAPPRSRRKRRSSSVVSILVVVITLGVCGLIGWKAWEILGEDQEATKAWNQLAALPSDDLPGRERALTHYLETWPSSEQAGNARTLLEQVREQMSDAVEQARDQAEEDRLQGVSDEELAAARDQAQRARDLASSRRDEMQELMPAKFEGAMSLYDDALSKESKRDRRGALNNYLDAVAAFAELKAQAATVADRVAEVNQLVTDYKILREDAVRLSIPSLAPDDWQDAESGFAKARALLDLKEFFKAKQALQFAMRDLGDAIDGNRAAGQAKFNAEESATIADSKRAEAVAAGAEEKAPEELASGDSSRADGARLYQAGDHAGALQRYRVAISAYEDATDKCGVAGSLAGPPKNTGADSGSGNEGDENTDAEIIDPPPSNDAAMVAQLAAIFGVTPTYQDGILGLSYRTAEQFQSNVSILKGANNIHFEEWRNTGRGEFVFGGEKQGMLLLDAVFDQYVDFEMKVRFYFVLKGSGAPFFRVLSMSDGATSFYSSDFGTNVGIYKGGRRVSLQKSRHKNQWASPTNWVQLGRDLKVAMKYETKNEKGVISVTHRFSQCATKKSERYTRGKIGFWWNNVVFVVKDLDIRGRLDDAWIDERLGTKSDD